MESKDKEIDTNLYSRQIGTFGMEMMGKLIKMNVMIQGLRGLGVETAKNLILAGPKSVDLYDPTLVSRDDLAPTSTAWKSTWERSPVPRPAWLSCKNSTHTSPSTS